MKKYVKLIVVLSLILFACVFCACSAKGQNMTEVNAKDATCTESGNIHYWTQHGKYYSDASANTEISLTDIIIPALGHEYINDVCSRCGVKRDNETPSTSVEYTLNVIASDGGVVNITEKKYKDITDEVLHAYPKDGYCFDGWYTKEYEKLSSDKSYLVHIDKNTIIRAIFMTEPEGEGETTFSESSELMHCDKDFAFYAYCPAEEASSIKDNLVVVNEYLYTGRFNEDKSGAAEEGISLEINETEYKNYYKITSAQKYLSGNAYIAYTKKGSKVKVNEDFGTLRKIVAELNTSQNAGTESDSGISDNLQFSVDEDPDHENIKKYNEGTRARMFDYVYNSADENVEDTVLDIIGEGITPIQINDDGTYSLDGDEYGFLTYNLPKNYQGEDMYIEDLTDGDHFVRIWDGVDENSLNTIYGRIHAIHERDFNEKIYFFVLVQASMADIFELLDVYQEDDLRIEDNAVLPEDIEEQIVEAFYASEDFHKFVAAVEVSAEEYANDRDLDLQNASFLDKINLKPGVSISGTKLTITIVGSISIPFETKMKTEAYNKDTVSKGQIVVSFTLEQTISFELHASVKFGWWFIFVTDINMDLGVVQRDTTHFNFKVAITWSTVPETVGFIANKASGIVHKATCFHVTQMLNTNKVNYANVDFALQDGYRGCKHCKPESSSNPMGAISADEYNEYLNLALKFENWGDRLTDIKEKFADANVHSDTKRLIKLGNFSQFVYVVWFNVDVNLVLNFKLQASVEFDYQVTNRVEFGVRWSKSQGLTSYSSKETTKTKSITIMGELYASVGIQLNVSIADPIKIIQVGLYAEVGVYTQASGIYHWEQTTDSTGKVNTEQYAAAYLEMGMYFEVGVSYSILYVFNGQYALWHESIPFLRLGYDQAIYSFLNSYDEGIMVTEEGVSLKDLGVFEAIGVDVKTFKTITRTINPAGEKGLYEVNYYFEKNKFTIDSKTGKVMPKNGLAYGETTDTLKISVRSISGAWKDYYPGNCVFYIETIEIPLKYEKVCTSHCTVKLAAVEPTCTETGLTEGVKCSICGEILSSQSVVAATGHKEIKLEAVDPTCQTTGLTEGKACSVCGYIIVAQKTVNKLPCQERTWEDEDNVLYDENDPVWLIDQVGTCVKAQKRHTVCYWCNKTLRTDFILPGGHTPGEWEVTQQPTCTENGLREKFCQTCGVSVRTETIHALGHTPGEWEVTQQSTCTENGLKKQFCDVCDELIKTATIAASGHTRGEWVITVQPSCTENGTQTASCEICGIVIEIEDIHATGHITDDNINICTTDRVCSVCEQVVERKTGHNWGTGRVTVEAKCYSDGEEEFTCSRCNETKTEIIPKTQDHNWSEYEKIDPTCTEDGYYVRHCLNEGCSYDDRLASDSEEDKSFGHNYVEDGYDENTLERINRCTNCGEIFRGEIVNHELTVICGDNTYKQSVQVTQSATVNNCTLRAGYNSSVTFNVEFTAYEFNGTTLNIKAMPDCDLTVTVVYTLITYTITYDVGDGTSIQQPKTYTVEDAFDLPTATLKGNTFNGWNVYGKEGIHTSIPKGTTGDLYLTANYTKRKYYLATNINMDNAGTYTQKDEYVEYQSSVTVTATTNPGYKWLGWYDDENVRKSGNMAYTFLMPANEITLTAKYELDKFNVTAVSDENKGTFYVNYTVDVEYLKTVTISNILPAAGYHFTGIRTNPEITVTQKSATEYSFIMPASDITIEGIWTPNTYTVVYNGNGATSGSMTNSTHTYDVEQSLKPNTYEMTGYSFIGWATSAMGEKVYDDQQSIKNLTQTNGGRVTLYAVWEIDLVLTLNEAGTVYIVSGYKGKKTVYIIPNSYNGKMITQIGDSVFAENNIIQSINIGENVTSIGKRAFYYCSSLTSITIPASVTSIGGTAFEDCYKLVEVYNKSNLDITKGSEDNGYVGYYALNVYTEEGGSKLSTDENGYIIYTDGDNKILVGYTGTEKELVLPEGITEIYQYAFYYDKNITKVTIPASVTSIGSHAFEYCRSLTSVTIGSGVTSIGYRAFYGCNSLIGVYYNGSIADWCNITFSGWSSNPLEYAHNLYINNELVTEIEIPDSVTAIGTAQFAGWNGTKITLHDNITSIGEGAFEYCYSLTYITIPDSVTSIGNYAFQSCRSLTSITIPDSVTSIGSSAFGYCYKLVEVYNKSSLNITKGSSNNGCVGYYALDIYTEEYVSKLSTDENGYIIYTDGDNKILVGYTGTETELVLPEGITEINKYAFYYDTNITKVTIPDGVTSIGYNAFDYCSSLTGVYYNGSIADWCNITFSNYDSNPLLYAHNLYINNELVTEIEVPDSVTTIGNYQFYGWKGTKITLHDNITSIGNYAFEDCSRLTSITIPASVTSIGNSAFKYCRSLTGVTIGNGVTSIGNGAFYNCSSLTSITIPDSVTSIGSFAFYGCSSLTSVTIGSGVTSIGYYVFYGCSSLTNITFKDTTTWYRTDDSTKWENKTGGTQASVTNTYVNATYFKSSYYCYWYKE